MTQLLSGGGVVKIGGKLRDQQVLEPKKKGLALSLQFVVSCLPSGVQG
jgi:hypothetical protein